MNTQILILGSALVSLAIGLTLYIWLNLQRKPRYFHTTNLISWLLIALFPVLLLYYFFPNSESSGTFFGFSVAGAIAAFIAIWWYGTRTTLQASKMDKLQQQLDGKQEPTVFHTSRVYTYTLKERPDTQIALITGGIELARNIDIWVSSENTNMEMARFYENSISGIIRYYGSRRDSAGDVLEDTIANELKGLLAGKIYVQPGTIFVTGSGDLATTHGVKKIFHAASVHGEIGSGYRPMQNIHLCVHNALKRTEDADIQTLQIRSILFPLLGVGAGRGNLQDISQKLLHAALSYLESSTKTKNTLACIYFLTWTDIELEICQKILAETQKLKKIG